MVSRLRTAQNASRGTAEVVVVRGPPWYPAGGQAETQAATSRIDLAAQPLHDTLDACTFRISSGWFRLGDRRPFRGTVASKSIEHHGGANAKSVVLEEARVRNRPVLIESICYPPLLTRALRISPSGSPRSSGLEMSDQPVHKESCGPADIPAGTGGNVADVVPKA